MFSQKGEVCNGFEFTCKQHIILNHVFFRYESSGGKIRGFQQRSWSATIPHRENIIQAGCEQFKPERTGLIEFKCTWYKRESRSLARTSALDFNKEGCVIQIRAD